MMDSGGVMPLFIEVGDDASLGLDRVVKEPVSVSMRAVEDDLGRLAPIFIPMLPHLAEIAAAHSARGDDRMLGLDGKLGAIAHPLSVHADDAAPLELKAGNLMLEQKLESRASRMVLERRDAFFDDLVACSPSNMPARDRVVRAIKTALRPVHHREEFDAALVQRLIDIFDGMVAIKLGPAPRPMVTLFETRAAQPIVKREIDTVLDAHSLLKRSADQMHTAKGFLCEPAEVGLDVLIDEEHSVTMVEELVSGDDPGESSAGDD